MSQTTGETVWKNLFFKWWILVSLLPARGAYLQFTSSLSSTDKYTIYFFKLMVAVLSVATAIHQLSSTEVLAHWMFVCGLAGNVWPLLGTKYECEFCVYKRYFYLKDLFWLLVFWLECRIKYSCLWFRSGSGSELWILAVWIFFTIML